MKLDLENVIKGKMDRSVFITTKMCSSSHYGMKTRRWWL